MRGLQKFVPVGAMDTDTDPVYIKQGWYRSAKNVSHLTDNTGSTQAIIPMKGNVAAFDLGSVSIQYKTYRIYTSDTSASPEPNFSTLLFYSNGIQFGAPTGTTATYIVNWSRNQPIAAQAASILAAITVWDDSSNTVVTAGATYIDITLNLIPGYDYTISATDGKATPELMVFNILNEAYDSTLTGELRVTGSYDLLGDLYVWSTTGVNMPLKSNLSVSSITLFPVGTRNLYKITFTTVHGLSIGQSVNLVGNTSSSIDGTWIISSSGFSTTAIVLDDYFSYLLPATPPTSIDVTLYANSLGEIGVGQYTASTDSWIYTRLGRTKQWSFRTKKQPDTYCEQTAVKSSNYWTDDFDVPRCFYYVKEYDLNGNLLPFVTDGIISVINPSGSYTYETIAQETRLQLTESNTEVNFITQIQSGGQVTSGNWRYAARLLTEGLTATTLTSVTNPVNVYLADANGAPALIIGDAPGTVTSKINQLEITGIQPGLFKYVELIGVNYIGNGVVGYAIKRELLSVNQTSIVIYHTGTETDTTDFDLGLLNQVFDQIATAKNIDVIDKRMILSNLTTKQRIDFTNWAQTIEHSVRRKDLTAVKSATLGTIEVGEYQVPENVNRYVGYTHNETIRFGVEVRIINGGWTDAFHVQDIKIDCDTTFPRRISALPDFNLTFNSGATVNDDICFSAFVSFSITNSLLDYRIDGIRVRDLIDGIRFVRAEVNPTVLACGIIVPSVAVAVVDASYDYIYDPGVAPYTILGEYPFISGSTGSTTPLYSAAGFRDATIAAFYSPDIQFGHTDINYLSGDIVRVFGNPFPSSIVTAGGSAYSNQFGQYSGRTSATNTVITPVDVTPTATTFMTYGQDVYTFPSTKQYKKQAAFQNSGTSGYSVNYITQSLVIESSAASPFIIPVTVPAQQDIGFYYAQYIRPLADQYGDVASTVYISTGHFLEINKNSGGSTEEVFGGDTFTQQNFLRHRTFAQDGIQFTGLPAPTTPQTEGFGGGVSFYCQNKINAQMKQKSVSQIGNLYPGISTIAWLDSIANTDGNNGEAYQEGYTIRNEVQSTIAFDPNQTDTSDQPARIRWSAIKPQGSASDQYRIYLFADFHDLDQVNGEIVHHANGNGELITWQQRAFMRQYFNTRGTLSVKGITEILIGDGSVMSRDGVTVSRMGSRHKWAIVKGKSQGGNDVFYWINTELKKVLRFGYDGTVSISDIKGMQSFMANNLTWVNNHDTPADGTGICGTWDDRYANVIWTVKGIRDYNISGSNVFTPWVSIASYLTGMKVTFSTDPFNLLGDVYESIDPNPNAGNQPDLFPLKWKKLPDNGTYLNQYTLVFNEFKNAFTTFATFLPSIYLKWTDTFLCPRPISPVYRIYQFNKGDYLTWWLHNGVSQTERGYLQFVVNQLEEETKWMEAIGVDSGITPIRFEFETKNHESFLIDTEFETREDSSYAPIKNDSTGTGINDNDTSSLYGKYMLAKMFFEIGVYQKLVNVITKFRISPRIKTK